MKSELLDVDELEFVLDAKNAIQVSKEVLKVYSFLKDGKEYSFAISKDFESKDSRGSYLFNMYGIFEGRIMPLEVRMFSLPWRSSVRTKTWESAECSLFEHLYDEIIAGRPIYVERSASTQKVAFEYLNALPDDKKIKLKSRLGIRFDSPWELPLYWNKKDIRCKNHLRMSYEEILAAAKATDEQLFKSNFPVIEEATAEEVSATKDALKKYAKLVRSALTRTIGIIETEMSKGEKQEAHEKAKTIMGKPLIFFEEIKKNIIQTTLFDISAFDEKPRIKRAYKKRKINKKVCCEEFSLF